MWTLGNILIIVFSAIIGGGIADYLLRKYYSKQREKSN